MRAKSGPLNYLHLFPARDRLTDDNVIAIRVTNIGNTLLGRERLEVYCSSYYFFMFEVV